VTRTGQKAGWGARTEGTRGRGEQGGSEGEGDRERNWDRGVEVHREEEREGGIVEGVADVRATWLARQPGGVAQGGRGGTPQAHPHVPVPQRSAPDTLCQNTPGTGTTGYGATGSGATGHGVAGMVQLGMCGGEVWWEGERGGRGREGRGGLWSTAAPTRSTRWTWPCLGRALRWKSMGPRTSPATRVGGISTIWVLPFSLAELACFESENPDCEA